MPPVQQLFRSLSALPDVPQVPGVRLRNYRGPADIEPWLRLRERAFAGQPRAPRTWTAADFQAEMLGQSWWLSERMWLAETDDSAKPVGSATLAMRGRGEQAVPVIHWLLVDPAWRRRGIGRLLVATLEAYAWEAGYREVRLGTHTAWDSAARFYEATGYRPTL